MTNCDYIYQSPEIEIQHIPEVLQSRTMLYLCSVLFTRDDQAKQTAVLRIALKCFATVKYLERLVIIDHATYKKLQSVLAGSLRRAA